MKFPEALSKLLTGEIKAIGSEEARLLSQDLDSIRYWLTSEELLEGERMRFFDELIYSTDWEPNEPFTSEDPDYHDEQPE